MAVLYIVATPIGNLKDITLRALDVLRDVAWIAAEDTRRTRLLLQHYGIPARGRLISFHEHNEAQRLPHLLQRLARGEDGALVSDAGTPLIHDPGARLVRAAWEHGHRVVPIPGPSAFLAALVASGLPTERFLFLGYPPRTAPERRAFLEQVAALPYTLLFYEAPHRLIATLEDMTAVLGRDRRVVVAHELTKVHESFFRGTLAEALAYHRAHPPKGEFTLVVEGAAEGRPWTPEALDVAIRDGLARGEAPSDLARRLARESGLPRGHIYRRILALRAGSGEGHSPEEPNARCHGSRRQEEGGQ